MRSVIDYKSAFRLSCSLTDAHWQAYPQGAAYIDISHSPSPYSGPHTTHSHDRLEVTMDLSGDGDGSN